jgi:large subunit ribosomal protein L22
MAGYSFKTGEGMVKASVRDLDISPKKAIEICTYIRGRSLIQGKRLLEMAINMEKPVPLKRFTNGPGHKPGIGAGRYYVKACEAVLKVLKSAEANAKSKGYSESELKITHLATQRASTSYHNGRQKRSKIRNIHIEVGLQESKDLKESSDKKSSTKTADKKSTSKKESKSNSKTESKKESDTVKDVKKEE